MYQQHTTRVMHHLQFGLVFSATAQQAKKGSSVYADGIEQSLPRPSLCHRLSSVSTADDALMRCSVSNAGQDLHLQQRGPHHRPPDHHHPQSEGLSES